MNAQNVNRCQPRELEICRLTHASPHCQCSMVAHCTSNPLANTTAFPRPCPSSLSLSSTVQDKRAILVARHHNPHFDHTHPGISLVGARHALHAWQKAGCGRMLLTSSTFTAILQDISHKGQLSCCNALVTICTFSKRSKQMARCQLTTSMGR